MARMTVDGFDALDRQLESLLDRKNVRRTPDASGAIISKVYPGLEYPVYDRRTSESGIEYYYVWVEDDSVWGWISSSVADLVN